MPEPTANPSQVPSVFLKYIPSQTTHPTSVLPLEPSILTLTTTAPNWYLTALTSLPPGEEGLTEHGVREDRQGQKIWGGPEKPQEVFGFFFWVRLETTVELWSGK